MKQLQEMSGLLCIDGFGEGMRMNSWQTVFVFLPERSRWIIQRKNMQSQM